MRKYLGYCAIFLIVAHALPASAATRGLELTSITTRDGEEIALYQGSYALLVGNSDYTAGWPDLPGVKKDIAAVQTELESQGFQVTVVENLTRAQLDQAFTAFITQYGQSEENRLLFYFSGHGHTLKLSYGDEMGYIVPVDAPNPNTDQGGFIASALDMQMIEVYAKRIQSKHALFLFDSCFSGSIFSLSRAAPESISYKTAQPVRQFITSGSAEEQVPDESIFRQQFVAALEGEGDINGDGYVTGAELGEFLQNNVVNYSKGSQHPQYGKIRHATLDKGDFVFQLPGAVKSPVVSTAPTTAGTTTAAVADPETEMWELVKDSTAVEDVKDFLAAYPDGKYAKVAELKLKQLEREQTAVATSTPTPQIERALQQATRMPTPANATEPTPTKQNAATQQQPAEQRPMSPPSEPGKEPLPPQHVVDALSRVRDDLLMVRDELAPLIRARKNDEFTKRADTLTKRLSDDIDAAQKSLEGSPQYEPLIPALNDLRENVFRKMDELIRLMERRDWETLQGHLDESIDTQVRGIEEHLRTLNPAPERDAMPPPNLMEALVQVRADLMAFREELAPLAKARKNEEFQDRADALTQKLMGDLDAAQKMLEDSGQYGHLIPILEALRENVPRKMEELTRLVQSKKWELLQETLEKSSGEMLKNLEERFPRLRDRPARNNPVRRASPTPRQPVERKRP